MTRLCDKIEGDLVASMGISEWTTVADALETARTRLLVANLRSNDSRFRGKPANGELLDLVRRLEERQRVVEAFRAAETATPDGSGQWELAITAGSALVSAPILSQAKVRYASALAEEGSLARASEVLKEVLIREAALGEAWIGRGHAFLKMGIPALADVHFSQPCILREDRVRLQQEVFSAMVAAESTSLAKERRLLASTLPESELRARAEILTAEGYLASASVYLAACCEYHVVHGNIAEAGEYLLRVSEAQRAMGDHRCAATWLQLCEVATRLNDAIRPRALVEAAAWLYLARDYRGVVGLLQEAPDVVDLKAASLKERLVENSLRRVTADAHEERVSRVYRIGRQVATGRSVSGVARRDSPMSFSKAELWIVDVPVDDLRVENPLVLGFGRFCGGIPEGFGGDLPSWMTVHDCRGRLQRRFFLPTLKMRVSLGNVARSTSPAHEGGILTLVVSEHYALLHPVPLQGRLDVGSDAECEQEELLVSFEDILATAAGVVRCASYEPLRAIGRDFSKILYGSADVHTLISSKDNTIDYAHRDLFAAYNGELPQIELIEPCCLAGILVPAGPRHLVLREGRRQTSAPFSTLLPKLAIATVFLALASAVVYK